MPGYKKSFKLNTSDVALIEEALRAQTLALGKFSNGENSDETRRIQKLLGKLHDQKIFYSHANQQGEPLG